MAAAPAEEAAEVVVGVGEEGRPKGVAVVVAAGAGRRDGVGGVVTCRDGGGLVEEAGAAGVGVVVAVRRLGEQRSRRCRRCRRPPVGPWPCLWCR